MLTFAQMGYLSGFDALLKDAFDHQLLNAQEYLGEVVRIMATAPAAAWGRMLGSIAAQSGAPATGIGPDLRPLPDRAGS